MEMLWRDISYGLRSLGKRPLFAAVALATLALGIGANTAIFTVVNAVLLAPLPYEKFDELVMIWKTTSPPFADKQPESVPNFRDLREQNQVFEQISASRSQPFIVTDGDEPERINGARVSVNLFSLLRVKPLLGRDFLPTEDQPGATAVVMMGHKLWQQRYRSDPALIGRALTVDGTPYTVIGILPDGVYYPTPDTNLYVPLVFRPNEILRGMSFLRLLGRLKPGVSLASASSQMDLIGQRLAQQYPAENTGSGYHLVPLRDQLIGPVRPALLIVFGAVGCLLLIACANVANLLLARAAARRTEFAVRAALGATRMQLLRQMLIESLLLSLLGGTIGLLLAVAGLPALIGLSADSLPRVDEIRLNLHVLGFTALVCLLTGLVFGLLPALRSSSRPATEALREGRRGSTASVLHKRLLHLLVVGEVAIALVLLVAAGLLIRSFAALNRVSPGFDPKGVLTIGIGLPSVANPDIAKQARFYDLLLTDIRTVPGVESAASIIRLPMLGFNASTGFTIQERPVPPENAPNTDYRAVSQDYFKSMRIPLLAGRDFTDREMKEAPDVLVINQTMAQRFFPGENPIGKRLQIFPEPNRWREIVGIVGDVKLASLDSEVNPVIYVPLPQNPYPNALRNVFLVARTTGDPNSLVAGIRTKLRSIDKNVPISQVQTMEEIVSASLSQRRMSMSLLVIFAVLAALLATVGIYGVMAYTVTQRTTEIGIRMAMGAQGRQVQKTVLLDGAKLTVIGVALGLVVAIALTRIMHSLLYEVRANDPFTFFGVSLLLIGVALMASYLPARRASRMDPLAALRDN